MEGDKLKCSCGKSDGMQIASVTLLSGFEPGGTIVETVLKTNLPNEDMSTLVSQRRIRWQDAERKSDDIKDVISQVAIKFYCHDCNSWKNTFSVTERQKNEERGSQFEPEWRQAKKAKVKK